MRILLTSLMAFSLMITAEIAQADPLSGSRLKAALGDTVLVLSKNGRKVKRRLEVKLHKNGTGGSLHVPSGQFIPLTWAVKGRELCLTQADKPEFCMITEVIGRDIRVQLQTGDGKTRQLKGTITPL